MGKNISEYCYIGRKSCGCVVAACCDQGDENTASDVADFIKSGYTIERIKTDEARVMLTSCKHK